MRGKIWGKLQIEEKVVKNTVFLVNRLQKKYGWKHKEMVKNTKTFDQNIGKFTSIYKGWGIFRYYLNLIIKLWFGLGSGLREVRQCRMIGVHR